MFKKAQDKMEKKRSWVQMQLCGNREKPIETIRPPDDETFWNPGIIE